MDSDRHYQCGVDNIGSCGLRVESACKGDAFWRDNTPLAQVFVVSSGVSVLGREHVSKYWNKIKSRGV